MKKSEVKELLEERYQNADPRTFIQEDPLSIPHAYTQREDIEIMAFLTATISWGQRGTIIKSAKALEEGMGKAPYSFIMGFENEELERFRTFQHRTFNEEDLRYFLKALQHIYREYGGMEQLFEEGMDASDQDLKKGIRHFRNLFFSLPHPKRTEKHVADPAKGSSAKRLNMFLRWMVRDDGIDLGLWKGLGAHRLSCPLDLHSANVARKLGLIHRKQNDAKTVAELDRALRRFDPQDPVKYDIALHRMGVEETKPDRKQA